MQKKLISSAHIDNPKIILKYYIVEDDGRFGIMISSSNGERATRFLSAKEENIYNFITKLAEFAVTPYALNEFADDFQYEVSSC